MLKVSMDNTTSGNGDSEVNIAEGGFVSSLDVFHEWDDIPRDMQKRILELRDSIKISLKELTECLNAVPEVN